MIISINSNIAVAHSINAAIFLQQLSQWTFLNLANKRHIYDGHVWSFNSLDAYATIFPFWNRRQLETLINNLVNEGLILKGNYNKHKYDRTCWYALTYKSLNFFPELMKPEFLDSMLGLISQKCEMETPDFGGNTIMENHFTKMRNGNHENVTPIPTCYTTKESISKDIHTPDEIPSKKPKNPVLQIEDLLADNPHSIPEPMLEDWLTIRKGKKAKVTPTAWKAMNKTLVLIKKEAQVEPIDAFEKMVANAWQSIELKYFVKGANENGKQVSFPGKGKQNEAEIYGWK